MLAAPLADIVRLSILSGGRGIVGISFWQVVTMVSFLSALFCKIALLDAPSVSVNPEVYSMENPQLLLV